MYSNIIAIKNFWTKKTSPDIIRGFFDENHYKKVIEAKIKKYDYDKIKTANKFQSII